MRVRLTPIALGGWLAVACVAAGTVGSGCNALSGIGDFEVVAEAGAEAAADVGQGEGSTPIDAAPREEAGEAAVDTPADAGHAADADAAAGSDGGRGDAPAEAAHGSDASSDAGADAPVDVGADAPVTCSATCDAGGCPVMHSNGLGQPYYDCTPVGTYNQTQAMQACTAFTGNASLCAVDPINCGGSNEHEICSSGFSSCGCWRYSGLNSGLVNQNATCLCIPGTAPSWN